MVPAATPPTLSQRTKGLQALSFGWTGIGHGAATRRRMWVQEVTPLTAPRRCSWRTLPRGARPHPIPEPNPQHARALATVRASCVSTHRHPPPGPPCGRWRTRTTNPMVHKRNKSSDLFLVPMRGLANELPVSTPVLLLIGGVLSRRWAGGTNSRPDVSLWARRVWAWKRCVGAGPIHVGSRIQAFVPPSGRFCVSS